MKAGQPLAPGREVVAVLACLAVFALLCRLRALGHPYPFYDDVAYLAAAEHVRDLGGPWAMVQGLFAGTYREDQRNPLYLGVLSLIADREPAFHLRAQALNAALGIAMLLAWWAVARRRIGPGAALVLLAFLAASETAIAWSSHEA